LTQAAKENNKKDKQRLYREMEQKSSGKPGVY